MLRYNKLSVQQTKQQTVLKNNLTSSVTREKNKNNETMRLTNVLFLVVTACLFLIILTIFELKSMMAEHQLYHHEQAQESIRNRRDYVPDPKEDLTYSIFARDGWEESGYLKHVIKVLKHYGYNYVPLNNQTQHWDLLWAHDYPFTKLNLRHLKPHQLVNHFPGTGFITNKMDLAVTNHSSIPRAFHIPGHKDDLLNYAAKHPETLFVQKNNNHRGIVIKPINELDLDKASESFVQEFIHNPLLIDGHKFDIGLYTIITSIDPLTVYIYSGEVLFRFCPVKYHPFDPKNVDKYVVGDDYLPTWEVPSLRTYYTTMGYNMKESFDAYVRKTLGKDPSKVWSQVDDAIRAITLTKEPFLAKLLNSYASKDNFFEMMRFDFVIDDELNVFVMEANMSPNLSSAHFPPNRLLYEQVLYNLFSIAGLGVIQNRLKKNLDSSMEVSIKNLVVDTSVCSSDLCSSSCVSPKCQLCKVCLSDQTLHALKKTYIQYLHKRDAKRIFPPLMNNDGSFNTTSSLEVESLSPENQLLVNWFRGKCLQDSAWC